MKKKNTQGGAREGAGRKSIDPDKKKKPIFNYISDENCMKIAKTSNLKESRKYVKELISKYLENLIKKN